MLGTLSATDEDSEDTLSWSMDLTDNFMIIESTGELIYIDIPTVGQTYEFMAFVTDGNDEWDHAWVTADIHGGNISPEFDGFIPNEQEQNEQDVDGPEPWLDYFTDDPMGSMPYDPGMNTYNDNIDNFEFDLPHNFENGIIGTLNAYDENVDDILTWSIDDNSGYFEVNETNGDLTYLGGAPSTTRTFEFYAHVNDNTGTNNATDIAFVTVKRLPNTRPEFDGEEKEVDILGDQVTIYEEDGTSEIYTIPRGNGDDPNTNQSGASDPTPYTAQYYFYGTMDTFEFDVPHHSTGGIFGMLDAHDNEGDALTWTINDTSGYFEVDANTGELSYLGGAPTGESFRFYAEVLDSSSAVNYTDAAFVTVNRISNRAPEFDGEEKSVIIVGDQISIIREESESDNENNSYIPPSAEIPEALIPLPGQTFFGGTMDVFEFKVITSDLGNEENVFIGSAPAYDDDGDPLTYTSENSAFKFWDNNGEGEEYDIYYNGDELEIGSNKFIVNVSDLLNANDRAVIDIIVIEPIVIFLNIEEITDTYVPPVGLNPGNPFNLTQTDWTRMDDNRQDWLSAIGGPHVSSELNSYDDLLEYVERAEAALSGLQSLVAQLIEMEGNPQLHSKSDYLNRLEDALFQYDKYMKDHAEALMLSSQFIAHQWYTSSADYALVDRVYALPSDVSGFDVRMSQDRWDGIVDANLELSQTLQDDLDAFDTTIENLQFTQGVAIGLGITLATGGAGAWAMSAAITAGYGTVAWGAAGTLLAYGVGNAASMRVADDQSPGGVLAGTVSDISGFSSIYIGWYHEDPITGEKVELTPSQSGMSLGSGIGQIGMLVVGAYKNGSTKKLDLGKFDLDSNLWGSPPKQLAFADGLLAEPIANPVTIAVPYPTTNVAALTGTLAGDVPVMVYMTGKPEGPKISDAINAGKNSSGTPSQRADAMEPTLKEIKQARDGWDYTRIDNANGSGFIGEGRGFVIFAADDGVIYTGEVSGQNTINLILGVKHPRNIPGLTPAR